MPVVPRLAELTVIRLTEKLPVPVRAAAGQIAERRLPAGRYAAFQAAGKMPA